MLTNLLSTKRLRGLMIGCKLSWARHDFYTLASCLDNAVGNLGEVSGTRSCGNNFGSFTNDIERRFAKIDVSCEVQSFNPMNLIVYIRVTSFPGHLLRLIPVRVTFFG